MPAKNNTVRKTVARHQRKDASLLAEVEALREQVAALQKQAAARRKQRKKLPHSKISSASTGGRAPDQLTTQPVREIPVYELKASRPVAFKQGGIRSTTGQPAEKLFDGLIDRARMAWLLRDWNFLSAIDPASMEFHPDGGKLAILAAAGCLQKSERGKARDLLAFARKQGCHESSIIRVLAAGVYTTMARIASLQGKNPLAEKFSGASTGLLGLGHLQVAQLLLSRSAAPPVVALADPQVSYACSIALRMQGAGLKPLGLSCRNAKYFTVEESTVCFDTPSNVPLYFVSSETGDFDRVPNQVQIEPAAGGTFVLSGHIATQGGAPPVVWVFQYGGGKKTDSQPINTSEGKFSGAVEIRPTTESICLGVRLSGQGKWALSDSVITLAKAEPPLPTLQAEATGGLAKVQPKQWIATAESMIGAMAGAPCAAHALPSPLVVSLTSHPARFDTLHLTLGCLLAQSVSPDQILLWIAEEDQEKLPQKVRDLEGGSLTICWCDDLSAYKKIIPALEVHQDAYIATADDDIFYTNQWLEGLISVARRHPADVIAHIVRRVSLNELGAPTPYLEWGFVRDHLNASPLNFPTGSGGILYPPRAFHAHVKRRDLFQSLAPTNDDVWLYWMWRLAGLQCRYSGIPFTIPAVSWPGSQDSSLWQHNRKLNDTYIAAMIKEYGFPAQGEGAKAAVSPTATKVQCPT